MVFIMASASVTPSDQPTCFHSTITSSCRINLFLFVRTSWFPWLVLVCLETLWVWPLTCLLCSWRWPNTSQSCWECWCVLLLSLSSSLWLHIVFIWPDVNNRPNLSAADRDTNPERDFWDTLSKSHQVRDRLFQIFNPSTPGSWNGPHVSRGTCT